MKGFTLVIDKMKNERDYFLSKFKPFGAKHTSDLLSNPDLTLENLIQHKTLIEKLLGELKDKED